MMGQSAADIARAAEQAGAAAIGANCGDLLPAEYAPLIAGMRDRLAHRYFESEHSIIEITVTEELDDLEGAIRRLLV